MTREWLQELDVAFIEFEAADQSISGRAAVASLLDDTAVLPSMPLTLKAGKRRHKHDPISVESVQRVDSGAEVAALTKALDTALKMVAQLSQHVNAQVKASVDFQIASARGQLDLFAVHNDFVASHARFILGSSHELGIHAATVAAQQSPQENQWAQVARAGAEALAPYIGPSLARMLSGDSESSESSDADSNNADDSFSVEDIAALASASDSAEIASVLDSLVPDAPVTFERMRAALMPHRKWIMANLGRLAPRLAPDMRAKMQRFFLSPDRY
jgi:hypothetical protein